jgi:hypothetical protein
MSVSPWSAQMFQGGPSVRFTAMPVTEPVTLEAGTAWRIEWSPPFDEGERRPVPSQPAQAVRIQAQDSSRLVLEVRGRTVHADLGRLIAMLPVESGRRPGSGALTAEQASVSVTDSSGARQGQLLVWHLMVQTDSTGTRIGRLEGLLILREAGLE